MCVYIHMCVCVYTSIIYSKSSKFPSCLELYSQEKKDCILYKGVHKSFIPKNQKVRNNSNIYQQ